MHSPSGWRKDETRKRRKVHTAERGERVCQQLEQATSKVKAARMSDRLASLAFSLPSEKAVLSSANISCSMTWWALLQATLHDELVSGSASWLAVSRFEMMLPSLGWSHSARVFTQPASGAGLDWKV